MAKRTPKPRNHRKEPDPMALALGQRVKALWEERGLGFDSFVEKSGIGRGYVSELHRGLVVCTIHLLKKIADALDLTPADLLLGSTARERLFDLTRNLSAEQVGKLMKLAREMAEQAKREKA